MPKLPPLTTLRAFEVAARLLSFKRAAAELGVTPTAISHQIKLLEQHCGQPLFRRRPRPLALTRAGRQLFPVIRDGFESFAEALGNVRSGGASGQLRVTCTNAFAARWLLPRLSSWRSTYPELKLDIIGTDAVLDLNAGEADIAIRYSRKPPPGLVSVELTRDTFLVVASPQLIGAAQIPLSPENMARLPLIGIDWPESDIDAPTWRRWAAEAGRSHGAVPDFSALPVLSFREETHAIEAAIAGQGIAICSDVLASRELSAGALVGVSPVQLLGYGFHIAHRAGHPKLVAIKAFTNWARNVVIPSG